LFHLLLYLHTKFRITLIQFERLFHSCNSLLIFLHLLVSMTLSVIRFYTWIQIIASLGISSSFLIVIAHVVTDGSVKIGGSLQLFVLFKLFV